MTTDQENIAELMELLKIKIKEIEKEQEKTKKDIDEIKNK